MKRKKKRRGEPGAVQQGGNAKQQHVLPRWCWNRTRFAFNQGRMWKIPAFPLCVRCI